MELLILVPVLLLLLAAAMLVVSQIVAFFQFRRFSSRQRTDRRVIDSVMRAMSKAHLQLSRRGRELEQASRRLGESNEELARLNSMKTKFLSMAVHDVRTPLSTVKGFAQMLGNTPNLGPKERRYVDYIRSATDQINSLMGDLTDLAVIEAGKFTLRFETLDLASFLTDITPGISLVAAGKNVSFSVAETPADNPTFRADRQRLARVLTNLLGNAVKFTPAGGSVELRVRLAGGILLFSVKDTGPGIHPTERKRIFEKFYQSRFQDAKARAAGWGLGLAIAEEIVRSHGGKIGVDSPGLGRGSTFWVRIPVEQRRVAPAGRAMRAAAFALAALAAFSGAARAQQLPLDEKARYEDALEQKADGVLLRLLGPNRYKVVVDATLDFTRIESFDSKEATAPARGSADSYLWGSQQTGANAEELLPGIPVQEPGGMNPAPPKAPQSYVRRNSYARNFLQRMAVTVVLDETLPPATAEKVRTIVTDVLGVNSDRGDTLNVVRAPFVPAWKTLWYEKETAGLILKYILITILSLLTLTVVAVCLLRLSGAMSDMANAQTQQLSMDMNGQDGGLPGPDDAGTPALPEPGAAGADSGDAGLEEPGEGVRFEIRADQIEALEGMLAKEDPANIAIICVHLDPSIRSLLLGKLPPEVSSEVMVNLGHPRFIEPEMILNLKEEIERRLAGTVGGIGRLVKMIEESDFGERSRIIDGLAERDPALAEQLRGRVFTMENLQSLTAEEWSLLLTRLTNEEWGLALSGASEGVLSALRQATGASQWRILEQLLSSPSEPEARRAAQQRLVQEASALEREGRLVRRGLALTGSADKKEAASHVA